MVNRGSKVEYQGSGFKIVEGPVVYDYNNSDIEGSVAVQGNLVSYVIPQVISDGGFTIDPVLDMIWNTTDTSLHTTFTSIAVTDSFQTITVGESADFLPVFPQVNGSYTQQLPVMADAVIMKTDIKQDLIWATYLGGSKDDGANAVTVTPTGIFLTGYSQSWNFPQATMGSYNQPVQLAGQDAFIAKFDNEGKWKWATGYGGDATDEGVDMKYYNGNVYVVGQTYSNNFPVLVKPGAYNNNGTAAFGDMDGFLLQYDTLGNLTWATYFGLQG